MDTAIMINGSGIDYYNQKHVQTYAELAAKRALASRDSGEAAPFEGMK